MNAKDRLDLHGPWSVYITYRAHGIIHFGTGVLIDFNWVLTEAHIFEAFTKQRSNNKPVFKPYRPVMMISGSLDRNTNDPSAQVTEAAEVYIYPEYSYTDPDVNSYNDIALVRLSRRLNHTNSVSPMCLSQLPKDLSGMHAEFQGWGALRVGSSHPARRLHQARVQIVAEEKCKKQYNHGLVKPMVMDSHVCAEGKESDQDKNWRAGRVINHSAVKKNEQVGACAGDSGGGLMIELNDRKTLVGLTSWGGPCDNYPNHPMVFTRVNSYLDWIELITGLRACHFQNGSIQTGV